MVQPSSLGHGVWLVGEQLSKIGRWLVTSLTWMRANMTSDAQVSVRKAEHCTQAHSMRSN